MTDSEIHQWVEDAKRLDAEVVQVVDRNRTEALLKLIPSIGQGMREAQAHLGSQEGPYALGSLAEEFRQTPRSVVVAEALKSWASTLIFELPEYKESRRAAGHALTPEEAFALGKSIYSLGERIEHHLNVLLYLADKKAGYDTKLGRYLLPSKQDPASRSEGTTRN